VLGLFKRKEAPAQPGREAVVPRIKHVNFVSALKDMGAFARELQEEIDLLQRLGQTPIRGYVIRITNLFSANKNISMSSW